MIPSIILRKNIASSSLETSKHFDGISALMGQYSGRRRLMLEYTTHFENVSMVKTYQDMTFYDVLNVILSSGSTQMLEYLLLKVKNLNWDEIILNVSEKNISFSTFTCLQHIDYLQNGSEAKDRWNYIPNFKFISSC